MKQMLISMFLVVLLLLSFSLIMTATTRDTIRVWANPVNWPSGTLDDIINSDTIAGGFVNPNHVFVLQNNGPNDSVFFVIAPITVKGSITVIGKINPVTGKPPVVAPYIKGDNSSISDYFEPQGNDTLTLKGLYFIGTRADGAANTGRFVNPTGDYNVFIFDHCILENITGPQTTPNLFDTWAHAHCSFYITNCEFRNNQDDAVGNPGFAWIECASPTDIACDTAYFRNNTFFFTGGLVLGGGGYAPLKLDFQHNTIFMSTQQGVFQLYYLHNAVIRNNVFYSVGSTSQPLSWGDTMGTGGWGGSAWFSGLISLDTLKDVLKSGPLGLTEAGRHVTITNNAYCWPSQITAKWSTYVCQNLPFVTGRGNLLTDKTTWPNINVASNDSIDPAFDSELVSTSIAKMLPLIDSAFTAYSANGYRPYVYPMANPGDVVTWGAVASNWATTKGYPVVENLRYTNTALQTAGTDGKALGDLNWFPEQLTGVSQSPESIPMQFTLHQNYPNPFNPSTKISYTLSVKGMARLSVYDILGKEVAVLFNEVQNAGQHEITFNAEHLSSGVYFCKLMSSGFVMTQKMILMK
jgi:hypothetical protein